MTKEYPWGKGTPTWVRDATLNDSDKSFTVPAGKVWALQSVVAEIDTSATVGNRLMNMQITDGTDLRLISTYNTVAASQKGNMLWDRRYTAAPSTTVRRMLSTTVANSSLTEHLPDMILGAGSVVRVWDASAIDAAADDLIVILHYVEYDV